jgi:hypothetical protein
LAACLWWSARSARFGTFAAAGMRPKEEEADDEDDAKEEGFMVIVVVLVEWNVSDLLFMEDLQFPL